MSRDPTWAATSVPEIRGRWCNALDAMADGQAEMIASPPEGGAAGVAKRIERMQEKATAALEVVRSEAAALRGAELYWVARSMVDAAVGFEPPWRTLPSPAGSLENSRRNGGSGFPVFVANPSGRQGGTARARTTRFRMF